MNIPFRVKTLTDTAKIPTQENGGDLWDLYADDFCLENLQDRNATMYKSIDNIHVDLATMGRILVKTGISIELPTQYNFYCEADDTWNDSFWFHDDEKPKDDCVTRAYAVADIRPRSGLALKHGITVLNTPGTIDNSYRKEIGVILYNAGHEPYTINKGDKIAQMLIRPLYPSKMEIVDNINDTGRGGYGSTGK